METFEVLLIGGSVYDITAKIKGDTVPADSNPSVIYGGCGGVGRNIAVNAAKMGVKATFMTALGTDSFAHALEESCQTVGLDLSNAVRVAGGSSIYLSILDRNGELTMAASDLALLEAVSPDAYNKAAIAAAPIIFVDANLPEDTLKMIAETANGELYADAVSVKKGLRLRPVLNRLHTLKANRAELAAISGMPAGTLEELRAAAGAVLKKGVRRVFVTMGLDGCAVLEGSGFDMIPAFPVAVNNVTGAGDAFSAAILFGTVKNMSSRQILRLGTAAARIALCSAEAVSRDMSPDMLMKEYATVCRLADMATL